VTSDLRTVFARVANELAELGRTAERLQQAVGAAGCGQPAIDPVSTARPPSTAADRSETSFITLQSLDRLTQSLQCLSEFLARAAHEVPRTQADLSAAIRTIRVGDLAARIEGRLPPARVTGAAELFDLEPEPG
jgi:ABC-type transporter Mla subunit MlaD